MDKISQYREFVKHLVSNYADSDIPNDKVDVQLILDVQRDRYLWMNVGWHGADRIYRSIVHLDIKDGKIWLQQNLIEIQRQN